MFDLTPWAWGVIAHIVIALVFSFFAYIGIKETLEQDNEDEQENNEGAF